MLVVLGGSSPWTVDLVERLEPDRVLLVGQNHGLLVALRRFLRARSGSRVEFSTNPELALRRASVVLCQVRVGGWAGRRADEATPPLWGGYGDETLGIGGLRAALRASRLLAKWARAAGNTPVVMLSNPTDLLTRWWRLHSGGPALSVCEAPTELLMGLPPSTRYFGVNHLGWALTPDGQRVPTRWMPAADVSRTAQAQRARACQRADELSDLSAALERAIVGGDHDRFDALIHRRSLTWYELVVVPVLRALLRNARFSGVIGLPNEGRLPSLAPDVILESLSTVSTPAAPPAELVGDVAALAASRQRAWEVLLEPTPKRLARFTECDPFSAGARYPPDLFSWMTGHD
jgi:alpha-galactosidase/6-phospho-beta-glucosidase family protein